MGWVKAQFYVLNFQLEILEWFFIVFFFSSYQHTKIGFGTKYRSVRSAYISLSFSEVENDPFSNEFSIELSVWSCSARMPFFCAAGGAGRLAGRGIGSFRGFVRSSTWFVQNRRGTTKPNRVRRERVSTAVLRKAQPGTKPLGRGPLKDHLIYLPLTSPLKEYSKAPNRVNAMQPSRHRSELSTKPSISHRPSHDLRNPPL